MHQNVARCRDGDVSRVSLKYDAAECSPGLVSMEWYPSLFLDAAKCSPRLVTPSCSWSFSTSWFFHAGTHVLQRHVAPSLHLFLFCGKRFYSPCFFAFSGVQAALWHVRLALKARAEAVLTTILYMPFDVVYYLFLCVLLLLRQLGLLSMEWYPSLILKFFHQLIFPCRHMCSLETLGTIPTSLLVFVENIFTSLVTFYGVQAALWQFES